MQYATDILNALKATGITNTSPGAKARALADIIANEMGILDGNTFTSATQYLLPYATNVALDFLGDIHGVARIQAQDASAPASDSNFEFYVTTGTFGDINNGQDIIVPAGTRIFTSFPNGPIYSSDTTVTLPASAGSSPFSASSTNLGSSGNAPASIFTQHNFTNYTDSLFGSLLVTNNYGIIGGRDQEDDESYRYRIKLKLQSAGGVSESDLRGAILQIPGIQDVVFKSLAGTYEVYIYGISPAVPPSLLHLVQVAINNTTAYPLTGLAIVPDLVGISIATTITMKPGLSNLDQSEAAASAIAAAQNYIDNLNVGQELIINQIASLILTSDPRILDVGNPNQPLNEIFIWRGRTDGSRYSQYLIADYAPAVGERLLVEESIDNPIKITVSS